MSRSRGHSSLAPRGGESAAERRLGTRAPRVLVVAGLDPSGGAGLAADVEALLAVGARPLPVATALTVQGPAGALGYRPVGAAMLTEQVEGLLREAPSTRRREAPIAAVKTGMLGSAASVTALSRVLDHPALRALPLVVDPVLAASSGLPLLRGLGTRSPAAVLAPLLARATVVTPNWPELEALAGASLATEAAAVRAARALPCAAVLVKGGHRRGAAVDLLVTRAAVRRFAGRRRRGTARGTGCRLASALAGLLARGATLPEAVRGAKALVERYLDRELGW